MRIFLTSWSSERSRGREAWFPSCCKLNFVFAGDNKRHLGMRKRQNKENWKSIRNYNGNSLRPDSNLVILLQHRPAKHTKKMKKKFFFMKHNHLFFVVLQTKWISKMNMLFAIGWLAYSPILLMHFRNWQTYKQTSMRCIKILCTPKNPF